SLATIAWLAARTSIAAQPWRSTNATISAPTTPRLTGQPVTVTLSVADPNLSGARILWEARDQEPAFGDQTYTFIPPSDGTYWIEAEVQWLDGRRAFATNSLIASINAPPQLNSPQKLTVGGFYFQLAGTPGVTFVIQASIDLLTWQNISTNTLPAGGVSII